jgi:hypothetical protein
VGARLAWARDWRDRTAGVIARVARSHSIARGSIALDRPWLERPWLDRPWLERSSRVA